MFRRAQRDYSGVVALPNDHRTKAVNERCEVRAAGSPTARAHTHNQTTAPSVESWHACQPLSVSDVARPVGGAT